MQRTQAARQHLLHRPRAPRQLRPWSSEVGRAVIVTVLGHYDPSLLVPCAQSLEPSSSSTLAQGCHPNPTRQHCLVVMTALIPCRKRAIATMAMSIVALVEVILAKVKGVSSPVHCGTVAVARNPRFLSPVVVGVASPSNCLAPGMQSAPRVIVYRYYLVLCWNCQHRSHASFQNVP